MIVPHSKFFALFLIAILFLTHSGTFAFSEDGQTSSDGLTQRMANDLAECAGVFSAIGHVMGELGKKNAAQTYEDTARGAYLAAAFSNHMSEGIPSWENSVKWAQNVHEVQKTYWLALLELHNPTEEEVFPESFLEELDFCTSLNPVQSEIVKMMRELIYSQ